MVNIVLFEPEIPFNTAAIIRTAVASNANLHIIEPCSFDLSKDHPDLRRGSTNYLEEVELFRYSSFSDFVNKKKISSKNLFLLTRYGKKVYSEIEYKDSKKDVYIMFGRESTGIPIEILNEFKDNTFRIPMNPIMRSLNLSNCVALVTYDLLRKVDFDTLSKQEIQKKDYLN